MPTPKILAFAGSLRRDSYNKKMVAVAARGARDAGAEVTILDLASIPLPIFDEDLEARDGLPPNGRKLKDLMIASHGLLIASPEYNSSMSAALKNAIDWASRPANASVLNKKPCAILGASTGIMGTVRGQLAIRQALMFTETYVLLKPEVLIGKAAEKFDAELRLTDEPTRAFVAKLIAALVASVPAKP